MSALRPHLWLSLAAAVAAVGCSDSEDEGGSSAGTPQGALEQVLRRGFDQRAMWLDAVERLIAAAEDASGMGEGVMIGGFGGFGTVDVDLFAEQPGRETPVSVVVAPSPPADFSTPVTVSVSGRTNESGAPIENVNLRVQRQTTGDLTLEVTSGSFESFDPPFTMILFGGTLNVTRETSAVVGDIGFEIIPGDETADFIFGTMAFRATETGFAIDVTDSEGQFAFTIQ